MQRGQRRADVIDEIDGSVFWDILGSVFIQYKSALQIFLPFGATELGLPFGVSGALEHLLNRFLQLLTDRFCEQITVVVAALRAAPPVHRNRDHDSIVLDIQLTELLL